jgi:cellulose synthase/poly-beta-1,6-N-acetylglucosamine synthase-like glycosyltransferase
MEEVPIPPGQVLVKDAPREEVLPLLLSSTFPYFLPFASPYFRLLSVPFLSFASPYFASLCFPFYIIMHSILILYLNLIALRLSISSPSPV